MRIQCSHSSATVTITETAVASRRLPCRRLRYPKVVPISSLPERMQTNAREANPMRPLHSHRCGTALPEGTTWSKPRQVGLHWLVRAVKAYVAQTGRGGYSCH